MEVKLEETSQDEVEYVIAAIVADQTAKKWTFFLADLAF